MLFGGQFGAHLFIGQAEQLVPDRIDPRLLARFDATANVWRIAPGRYTVQAGANARDLPLTAEIALSAAPLNP